jgi:hypothetical protein
MVVVPLKIGIIVKEATAVAITVMRRKAMIVHRLFWMTFQ